MYITDIPLTPKELSLLTGDGGSEGSGVRASHSSESVLDAPDPPPPKPPRPHRLVDYSILLIFLETKIVLYP